MGTLGQDAFLTIAPDWVCEVLSPGTAKYDRSDKLRIYAREQVGWAWFVDPGLRTLEVLRRGSEHWLLLGVWRDDAIVRAEPFDAIELEIAALWQHVMPVQR